MKFFKTQTQKIIKNIQTKNLFDTRFLMLVAVTFIALSVFWNGAKIIQQNFQLQQKVSQIEQQNEILQLENRNKELQNEYLKTDEFADITARRIYGRGLPGERVYLVPELVARNAIATQENKEGVELKTEKPQWQQNFEAWIAIYFGG